MKISIIGTGYVGLVTGIGLAEKGHDVTCVDIDQEKVAAINAGQTPIHEPGLPALLSGVIGTRLTATTDLAFAVRSTDLTFIAVGTPFNGKEIDLRFIREAAIKIGIALHKKEGYHTVIVKSTVVPGTTDEVVRSTLADYSGKIDGIDFGVGVNPEFLSEGTAVYDFFNPDRIILGGNDEKTLNALAEVYASFEETPMLRVSTKTAEMIKYTNNALLATLISFSNEIANFCSDLGGIDAAEVTEAVRLNQYLTLDVDGERWLAPIAAFVKEGCGFGGSCLPKDVKALIARGEKAGAKMELLREVIRINEAQPLRLIALLKKGLGRKALKGVRVAVLGLAFKPETDDLRESPAITLIDALLNDENAVVVVYDPVAMPAMRKTYQGKLIDYAETLEAALDDAEAVLLVTSWPEFRRIPELLKKLDANPVVVDGRRFLDKNTIRHYYGIGL